MLITFIVFLRVRDLFSNPGSFSLSYLAFQLCQTDHKDTDMGGIETLRFILMIEFD